MSQLLKLTLWLVALLVIAAALAFVFTFFSVGGPSTSTQSAAFTSEITGLTGSMATGNFAGAIADSQTILNDPSATAEEKAMATVSVAGAQYYLSGSVSDELQDIDKLKQIVVDPSLSLQTRVNALNLLASQYIVTGGSPAVTSELFSDAPFSSYYVPNQPNLSARNLFNWSYSLMPTPEAAIHIAKWYADQYVSHPDLAATTTTADNTAAESYLNKAQSLVQQRETTDPTYLNSRSYYEAYQFWEAVVVGRLAAEGIAPYTTEYKNGFTQYLTFAQASSTDTQAQLQIYYTRFNYAQDLLRLGDTADANTQLTLLAQAMNGIADLNTNAFARLIGNTYTYPEADEPTGSIWTNMQALMAVSPDFKSAVDRIIATAPAPTN